MWQTLLPNQLFVQDNFLPDEWIDAVQYQVDPEKFKSINNQNTPPVMFDTKFDYDLLVDPLFRDKQLRRMIFEKMNSLAQQQWNRTLPEGPLHHMQYFFKRNNPAAPVAFDLHAEDVNIYGPMVFMLYLSDEVDGQLEIPTEEDAKEDWSKGFQDMVDNFPVWFSPETISIQPKKNRCVVMSTGLAHRVRKCSGTRPNISGWPFFKPEQLNTLSGWVGYKDLK
jgi:hypothetical protein